MQNTEAVGVIVNDKLVEVILADIKELKTDVKALLQFKWQIVGGSVVASIVVTGLIQFAAFLLKN